MSEQLSSSEKLGPYDYYMYVKGKWRVVNGVVLYRKFKKVLEEGDNKQRIDAVPFWSVRAGTGLFGLPRCKRGNHGPKSAGEVFLAWGDEGLAEAVRLGCRPCPSCRPQRYRKFWNVVAPVVRKKYPQLPKIPDFINKEVLGYDAGAVDWEHLLPILKAAPNRLYVGPNITKQELERLCVMFLKHKLPVPVIGYLDDSTPRRFIVVC